MNTINNWPQGFDLSHSNWTARPQRESKWRGGNYAPNSHRIPPCAWVVAAVAVAGLVALMHVAVIAGF